MPDAAHDTAPTPTGGTPPRAPRHPGQFLAALAVSLGPFAAGLGKGYSSPAIASLQDGAANEFEVDGQQASWLASLSLLGALFGAPLGGAAVRWGRRRALIAASAPLSLCWLATAFAGSVEAMCAAAFAGGALVAVVQLAAQVYVSEIAAPDVRGGLSALLKIAGHLGVLAASAAGAALDWRRLAALASAAPAAALVAAWRLPESPAWLAMRGRDADAARALRRLRGPAADLGRELAALRRSAPPRAAHRLRGDFRRVAAPAALACALMFFQRFSGAGAFHSYAVSVFRETFGATDAHGAAVAVAGVEVLAALLSGLLVDRAGRLPLLVASGVLATVALASFGSFAYYEEQHGRRAGDARLDWIPLLCALAFTVAFSLGIGPISWLVASELFPVEHRGAGTAVATAFSYLCAFVGVKTFVDLREALGLSGAFWAYAGVSVCGLCFVVCCVPETSGRELGEINASLG